MRARTMVIAGLIFALSLGSASQAPAQASHAGTSFYVDPANGSDAGPGTRAQPWRTLDRVTSAALGPGDRVFLARGRHHVGSLWISEAGTASAPISFLPYGTGSRPVISDGQCIIVAESAAYVRFSGLDIDHCAGSGSWRVGMTIEGDHVTVRDSTVTGNVIGIAIGTTADHALISHNTISHNNGFVTPPGCDDDFGAQGISVGGDHARITHNTIDGEGAPSPDYGFDGSAIEIAGANGTLVDHNIARNDINFSELGTDQSTGELAQNTTFSHNRISGSFQARTYTTCVNGPGYLVRQLGFIVRGSGTNWGPNPGTRIVDNTIHFTGAGSRGFTCYATCTPAVLAVRHNVLDAAVPGWADTDENGFAHSFNLLGPETPDAVRTWGSGTSMHRGDRYMSPRRHAR